MNPEGNYLGTINKIVASKSSTGKKCAECKFSITQYANGGAWVDIEPIERTVYLYLTEGAKKHTYAKLATLGLEEGKMKVTRDESTGQALIVLPEGAGDEQITLRCSHREYQGSSKEEWDWESWGGGAGSPLSDEELMEWQAML